MPKDNRGMPSVVQRTSQKDPKYDVRLLVNVVLTSPPDRTNAGADGCWTMLQFESVIKAELNHWLV